MIAEMSVRPYYRSYRFIVRRQTESLLKSHRCRTSFGIPGPLDGTSNFVAGLTIYASSIGVLYSGMPVLGTVHVAWLKSDGRAVHAGSGGSV